MKIVTQTLFMVLNSKQSEGEGERETKNASNIEGSFRR